MSGRSVLVCDAKLLDGEDCGVQFPGLYLTLTVARGKARLQDWTRGRTELGTGGQDYCPAHPQGILGEKPRVHLRINDAWAPNDVLSWIKRFSTKMHPVKIQVLTMHQLCQGGCSRELQGSEAWLGPAVKGWHCPWCYGRAVQKMSTEESSPPG